MASGFFALLDDITVLLDDVASMTKITVKKTAGILGDDLAVNAEKASGYSPSREIPVLLKITKASFIDKLIILPFAFGLSAFYPPAIKFILLLGGLYLAFEGAEKVYEFFFKKNSKQPKRSEYLKKKLSQDELKLWENKRVESAVKVDFILSLEIIVLALSTVTEESILVQILVVSGIAILATIGVYGLVALIVRLDDFGIKLIQQYPKNHFFLKLGNGMIKSLPYIIRLLSVVGTLAMLLVAGGIYVHHIDYLHHIFNSWPSILGEFVVGLSLGTLVLIIEKTLFKLFK